MTLEQLQHEATKLATEMRRINVRSFGLKPNVHDDWCKRMEKISQGLLALDAKKAPPPPPKIPV